MAKIHRVLSNNGYFSHRISAGFGSQGHSRTYVSLHITSYYFNDSAGVRIAGSPQPLDREAHFGPLGPNMVLSTLKRILRYSRIRMHPVSSSIPAQGFGRISLPLPVSIDLDNICNISWWIYPSIQLGCVQSRQCKSFLAFAMWSPQGLQGHNQSILVLSSGIIRAWCT